MDHHPKKKSHAGQISKSESIVFTKARHDPFSRVPKDALDIPTLSFKAKGIMAYLLGKVPGWTIRMQDLRNHGKESRDAIRAGLNELKAHGYADTRKTRDPAGRIVSHWRISDAPIFNHPETDFPAMGNPPPSKNEFSKNDGAGKFAYIDANDPPCDGHCGRCLKCLGYTTGNDG